MRWFVLCAFVLLLLPACADAVAVTPTHDCNAGLIKQAVALAGKGGPASSEALDATFGRLDGQSRVDVQETNCGLGLVSLRYQKPRRMQLKEWLKNTVGDPRETQIDDQVGYTDHKFTTSWIGMGVATHRLLLPDAWEGIARPSSLALYAIAPPPYPIRDLTLQVFTHPDQRVFIERWRTVLSLCPVGASCPFPNVDPRYFARFTAVLRVDARSGLPLALTTVAQPRGHEHGHFVWGQTEVVSETTFHYGGHFSIHFVKG